MFNNGTKLLTHFTYVYAFVLLALSRKKAK